MREIAFLEFIARRVWPALRPFARRNLSRRCTRCLLSENYTRIDATGVCDICREGSTNTAVVLMQRDKKQDTEDLAELLRAHEGKGQGRHDAVVCFSGGKDSCMLLHRLKKEFPKLRLVALAVDTGFMNPIAEANIKRVAEVLDVELVVLRPPFEMCRKMFAWAFTHLNEGGGAGTVDYLDGSLVFDVARNFAARTGTPLLLAGLSRYQAKRYLQCDGFEIDPDMMRQKVTEYGGLVLQALFDDTEMEYWWDGTAWADSAIPRWVLPLCAWDFSEEHISSEVVRLGLVDSRFASPIMTNHLLIPLLSAVDVAKNGYGSFEPEFASMVREKRVDRSYWLHMFELVEYSVNTGRFLSKSVDGPLERLGLTRADVGLPPA